MTKEEKLQKFQEICDQVKKCQNCQLFRGTTNGVPGEGNLNAEALFLGEGPGFNEDQQGRPFVGAAGKLLTESIQSLGWKRSDVFITNVVRHRPPNNRDPLPEEITACDIWTDQLLELIDPKVVVTLGRYSLGKFIPGVTISKTHGQTRLSDYKGRQYFIYPMFHPAAALRAGDMMQQFKEDFKKLPDVLKMNLDDLIPPLVPKEEKKEEPDQINLL
jgi:DNA polymerase